MDTPSYLDTNSENTHGSSDTTVRHSLSRPTWVDDDSAQGWVLICACGGWRSEPFHVLKQLKQEGRSHLHAA